MNDDERESEQSPLGERELDALLDASADHVPSAGLLRRVAQIPIEHPRATDLLWPFASWGRALGSAGLALSLGAVSGLVVMPEVERADDLIELSSLSNDDAWELEDMR